jgi:hypothetical protein
MAPKHVKRKFWWELIFISVLLFLLAGARSQRKHEVAAAQATLGPTVVALAPAIVLPTVLKPLSPLALK